MIYGMIFYLRLTARIAHSLLMFLPLELLR